MSVLSDTTSAILRRRAERLAEDGQYDGKFLAAFERAAQELEVRERCRTDDADTAANMVGDNRRLRAAIEQLYAILAKCPGLSTPTRKALLDTCARTLKQTPPAWEGRTIFHVSIGPNATRAELDAIVAKSFDEYFARKAAAPDGIVRSMPFSLRSVPVAGDAEEVPLDMRVVPGDKPGTLLVIRRTNGQPAAPATDEAPASEHPDVARMVGEGGPGHE